MNEFELAPAFAPWLPEPLNELVWAPPPPNGDWLDEPLLLNDWPPNGPVPEPADDDVPLCPPWPTFCDDEWLDEDVPWRPFAPWNVCVSDPLFEFESDPSAPCHVDWLWPDALFPLTPFWLYVSDNVCALLSDKPNCVCWWAFAALFALLRSPSGPISCWVPKSIMNIN